MVRQTVAGSRSAWKANPFLVGFPVHSVNKESCKPLLRVFPFIVALGNGRKRGGRRRRADGSDTKKTKDNGKRATNTRSTGKKIAIEKGKGERQRRHRLRRVDSKSEQRNVPPQTRPAFRSSLEYGCSISGPVHESTHSVPFKNLELLHAWQRAASSTSQSAQPGAQAVKGKHGASC